MSQCIKTGARILIVPYGYVVAADIHKVHETFVVIFNVNSIGHYKVSEATHKIEDSFDGMFRLDQGLIVVPYWDLETLS